MVTQCLCYLTSVKFTDFFDILGFNYPQNHDKFLDDSRLGKFIITFWLQYPIIQETLTQMGSFTERYPGIIIKVEPNKQRVVVKGNLDLLVPVLLFDSLIVLFYSL